MDYEKKYKEALQRAKEICATLSDKAMSEYIFPELKESEDERIRKELIDFFQDWHKVKPSRLSVNVSDILAWLEKQGQQEEPQVYETEDGEIITYSETDGYKVVEPKFNVGDWIVFNGFILHIDEVVDGYYRTTTIGGIPNSYDWDIDNVARLWSIQDAKEGDVLAYVTDEEDLWIMIYWSLYEPYEGHVHYHALLVNDKFSDKGTCCISINDLKPATKEQRDLLFQKMKESGYEWDAEKKEPKKIEQKPTDNDMKELLHTEYEKGKADAIAEIQNRAWSEEDESYLNTTIAYLKDAKEFKKSAENCINWLKSLKDRVQPILRRRHTIFDEII